MGSLREAPATVPALVAVGVFVVWATSQAGYPLTHWAPGALIVLALLIVGLATVPLRWSGVPFAVKLALGCLAAYTVLSYLSIVWAGAPGEAWEGANRTLLYLFVFALFALWPGRGTSAALLVGLWTFATIVLAVYVALRLDTATGKSYVALFSGERLSYPAGYPNATAAQWLMAFWPALLLARGKELHWAVRGMLAGGAVVLADVALFSLSRGSLYATPVMVVLVFALIPDRLRTFATAVPVAIGIGASAPFVVRVGNRIEAGHVPYGATHAAIAAALLAAVLVAAAVACGAAFEGRRTLSPGAARGVRRILGATALATLLVLVVGGLAVAGNPVTRARHSWESFEGGYSSTPTSDSRLLSGLGSNRYDFFRVALDEFKSHPVAGIGVDNFQEQYLRHGRSDETPRYPHSIELRTLTETGLIGALLAVVGLGAALGAGWRAMRRTDDALGATVAAAALAGFAYWAVHGSFDWFWEFAGLGAPAFALLGIVCSLASAPEEDARALLSTAGDGASPAASAPEPAGGGDASRAASARVSAGGGDASPKGTPRARGGWSSRRIFALVLGCVLALVATLSLVAPWLSEREVQSAARIWPKAPLAAYARLGDAAKLNPLSDRAYLVEGSIALRFGDLARARDAFSKALKRVPDDAYATLELGAIASEMGARENSLELLERAVVLNPRDPLTRQALKAVRAGRRVNVETLNRAILLKAEDLA
jgi:tetratricopeptide (TPR) repeat protein